MGKGKYKNVRKGETKERITKYAKRETQKRV